MRIDYCEVCDSRLTEEDFDSGKAFRDASGNVYCSACAPAEIKPRTGATPGRGSVHFQSAPGRPAPRPNARTGTSAPQKEPVPLAWMVLAGGVLLLALIGILYAAGAIGPSKGVNPPAVVAKEDTPAPKPIPSATPSERKTTTTVMAPTTEGEKPRGIFEVMAAENKRDLKSAAAKRLKDAVEFSTKYPQDPWTYLEMLRLVEAGTPSADEASRRIAELKVPIDKSDSPGWWRDWTFAQPEPKPALLFDFDGRKNIVQTKAPSHDGEFIFYRELTVPANKPFLAVAARTDDQCACKWVLEIEGRQHVSEELKGSAWRAYDIDLSEFKGKTATVQIRQVANINANPTAYFTPPVFHDAHDSAASLVRYSATAPAYVKPKPPPPPKHVFIAAAEWKLSAAWKEPTNLLAFADLNTGVVAGSWTLGEKGALHVNNAKYARLAIPYKLPAQYDIRLVFERKAGESDACLILAHGSRSFNWQMGAEKNKSFAITLVGGKKFEGNPAAVSTGNCLTNNQRYTTVVEVRKDRISAYLDGKLITEWVPDMGDLTVSDLWKIPAGKPIGLAAQESEVVFHSLELVEVK